MSYYLPGPPTKKLITYPGYSGPVGYPTQQSSTTSKWTNLIGKIIDYLPSPNQQNNKKGGGGGSKPALPPNSGNNILLLPWPEKDKNTPNFSGDPSLMRNISLDDRSGYYSTPIYGYSAEPWGPGLVDTFRGSGRQDPFFI